MNTKFYLIYHLTGFLVFIFFLIFGVDSIKEKKRRALVLNIVCLIGFGLIWTIYFILFSSIIIFLMIPVVLIIAVTVLFFARIGTSTSIQIKEINELVDQRDTIFSREEYTPDTEKHKKYYALRPELKKVDAQIRALPELLSPGGHFYDPDRSGYIKSAFDFLKSLTTQVDGKIDEDRINEDSAINTETIKEFVLNAGANRVGIAELNPAFIYSYVGRGPEKWGIPIKNDHKYVIVFTLEMDYFKVEEAPYLPITEETVNKYIKGAQISIALAQFIRSLGYPARAHIAGSNYQILLPPVAYEAGLGELGRHGYLITPESGSRTRLGAVTTDLPLITDKPVKFGIQDFCEKCQKCAVNCPSGAIPAGAKEWVRGVEKWQLNIENCLRYWRTIGTDCGLCMKVCPFSHPKSFVHDLIRFGVKRSAFARKISLYGDDLFYGKKTEF